MYVIIVTVQLQSQIQVFANNTTKIKDLIEELINKFSFPNIIFGNAVKKIIMSVSQQY